MQGNDKLHAPAALSRERALVLTEGGYCVDFGFCLKGLEKNSRVPRCSKKPETSSSYPIDTPTNKQDSCRYYPGETENNHAKLVQSPYQKCSEKELLLTLIVI
jgi:hypothetical protein